MNRDMEKNLIACLDSLEQGSSIEAALAGYPAEAAELRPYLETAGRMSQLTSLPSIAAQQQSQAAILAKAAVLSSPQSSPMPIWFTLRRLMMPLASLTVILFLLGFTLVTMSAAALPGDGLYSVKLGIEEFRLTRASDPERILVLAEQFQQERVREIEALLRSNRTADVLFEGEIEAIDIATWIIAGLPVQIDNDTVIDGTPQVGELARVDGRTADGQLTAAHIIVLTGTPDPEEIPLPALIPLLEPTETPEPVVTPTVTPTPAEAPGDSATIMPPATVVDPPATSTPASDRDAANGTEDDGSDEGDDGSADSDEPGEDDSDNGGDNENSNEEDEENSNEEDSDSGGDEGSDESGEDDSDDGGDNENSNEEDEENSNEEDSDSGDDEGSDEPDEDDSDNGGDNENSNEEDEANSNEEDSDIGSDEPGEDDSDNGGDNENSNEEDEANSNEEDSDSGSDEEDSGANENDDDTEESVDDGGDDDNE